MNKNLLLFFWLLVGAKFSAGQAPSIQWQKCLGGTNGEGASAIKQTLDGGFIVAGTTFSNNGNVTGNHNVGLADYWVVKLDSVGNLLWQKCYGGSSDEWLKSFSITNDGGFILAGYSSSSDGDLTGLPMHGLDNWIVKCDSMGNVQWKKNYGGSGEDLALKILGSFDGGYVVVGFSNSEDYDVVGMHTSNNCGGGTCFDGWVVKIDSSGNLQWADCYGGTWSDQINNVISTSDSGYILAALNGSDDGDATYVHGGVGAVGGNYDYWLVKIDSNGSIEWQFSYGGSDHDKPYGIINTFDGGYLVTGSARSNDDDVDCNHQYLSTDAWMIKIDSVGNLQWKKCLGGTDYEEGQSIIQLPDSGYLVLCNAGSTDGDVVGNHSSQVDVWLVKLDQWGNLEWQKCFGGSFVEAGYDMTLTSDGGLIFCGAANSLNGDVVGNHGDYDMWVVKLSPLPAAIANNRNPITDFTCHLNSDQEKLTLQFFADSREKVGVTLLDITGRVVVQKDIETTSGLNKNEIRTGPLSNGIYLVRLQTEQGSVTKKVSNSQ